MGIGVIGAALLSSAFCGVGPSAEAAPRLGGITLAQAAPAPATLPGQAGFQVLVPHGSGYVYVPLDASGRPIYPAGSPAEPARPSSPASPSGPSQAVPEESGGGGYYVVPPAGQQPSPSGARGGYHVVPKP